MSQNPAALQGWVKSIDPNSGRAFYANHVTRKTQWEPPEGWTDEPLPAPAGPSSFGSAAVGRDDDGDDEEDEPLPSNWEMMTDPSTGKPFYVDHERKITQWTRPKADRKPQARTYSYAPAETTTTNSAALARILQSARNEDSYSYPTARSYQQEASYFSHSHPSSHDDVDFSDALPALDFSVKKVADKYRLECPQCDTLFTLSKRRHHCRLCADVFCDACSNHRCELPLPGPEFEKPVRVCDLCFKDVEKGNFFSMRRYLTPLQLYDPATASDDDDDDTGAASPSNVNAALSGITQDLNQIVESAEGFEDKVSIPIDTLVPSITKHLQTKSGTSNRAIHALATLLSLGSMVGKQDFAHAVYRLGKDTVLNRIIGILERSGTDRKTLFVQEQAARALFYLTEPQVVNSLVQNSGRRPASQTSIGNNDDDSLDDYGDVESLDILRALKCTLDHSSMSKNIHLQRWAAATVRNLILEDQRRASMAINENAGKIASGEGASKLGYKSFLDQLIETGGIIILCSLVGSDDSDTRAHATAALGAILSSIRAIDEAMAALYELSGGSMGTNKKKDGDIIRAISAGGGCGSSVSQLLLSADNSVARMGCEFLASLVRPLLSNPQGCITLDQRYDCTRDTSGLGACREAALEVATSGCLPALLSIVNDTGSVDRPLELQKTAMETLAATVNAVGEMGKAWADRKYEEGISSNGAPSIILRALASLNEEHVVPVALQVLRSSSGESLGSNQDTATSRIRESAGIILGAMCSCSAEAIMDLNGQDVLPTLIVSSNDPCMMAQSTLRGDSAPRCVGLLETAASVLMFNWLHPSGASSSLLDRLLEALDVGIMSLVFQILNTPVEWDSRDKSSGGMKAQSAACRLICCIFGIAITSNTDIGMKRLMDACDVGQPGRHRQSKGPRNVFESVLTVLQTSLNHAHKMLVGSSSRSLHYQAALLDLVEAALLAVGSMCGSCGAPGGVDGVISNDSGADFGENERFNSRRAEVCRVACDVVIRSGRAGPGLLPSMLVGGFGEGVIAASLRLALAIAHHGTKEQHTKLAKSGVLVPTSDILRVALSRGELYNFSTALALIKFCGPYVSVGTGGETQAIKNSIAVVTNMLNLPINPSASAEQIKTQQVLKAQCIKTLESLSKNASLWSTISSDALPSIVQYLNGISRGEYGSSENDDTSRSALRAVKEIVQVPSNAASAAQSGLGKSIASLLTNMEEDSMTSEEALEVQCDAIAVLYAMLNNSEARRFCPTADGSILASVCHVIESLPSSPDSGKRPASTILEMSMSILHMLLHDAKALDGGLRLDSPYAPILLRTLAAHPNFVRKLCATVLAKTGMKVRKYEEHDEASSGSESHPVPDVYGPPLVRSNAPCCGYNDITEAADAFLFVACVLAAAHESAEADSFWNVLFDPDDPTESGAGADGALCLCAKFLSLIHAKFVPFCDERRPTHAIERSLVSYSLLETLQSFILRFPKHDITEEHEFDSFSTSVLVEFNIPSICLAACADQALSSIAFGILQVIIKSVHDDVLPLLVESKQNVMSLFKLLNAEEYDMGGDDQESVRRFVAESLEKLSGSGLLKDAVVRYGIRTDAIAGLAAACLRDQSHISGEDLTSSSLSSGLMRCLVDLCTYGEDGINLTPGEAEAIGKSLGKKICQMVISRFLERAKLSEYEIDHHDDMLEAPDIAMLCAIAQHESGLKELKSMGGFHALSLVAGEGELLALQALEKGCSGDPELLLEGETYTSLLSLCSNQHAEKEWIHDEQKRNNVWSISFALLSKLVLVSKKGRDTVITAPSVSQCIDHSIEIVHSMAPEAVNATKASQTVSSASESSVPVAPEDGTPEDPAEIVDGDDNASTSVAAASSEDKADLSDAESRGSDASKLKEYSPGVQSAAIGFLAALVSAKSKEVARLLDDTGFVTACTYVMREQTKTGATPASIAATSLVSALAVSATSETAMSTRLCLELLLPVVESEPKATKSVDASSTNPFDLYISAMQGLQALFGVIPAEQLRSVGDAVGTRLSKLIRSQAVPRTMKGNWNVNSGRLAFIATSFFLRLVGTRGDCINKVSAASLVQTIMWRVDPKAVLHPDDQIYWDAAMTQSLQVLCTLLSSNQGTRGGPSIGTKELTGTVLMIAKPGKAPRRAVDLASALKYVATKGEPTAMVSAQSLLERL